MTKTNVVAALLVFVSSVAIYGVIVYWAYWVHWSLAVLVSAVTLFALAWREIG
jgi:hypothetical protein